MPPKPQENEDLAPKGRLVSGPPRAGKKASVLSSASTVTSTDDVEPSPTPFHATFTPQAAEVLQKERRQVILRENAIKGEKKEAAVASEELSHEASPRVPVPAGRHDRSEFEVLQSNDLAKVTRWVEPEDSKGNTPKSVMHAPYRVSTYRLSRFPFSRSSVGTALPASTRSSSTATARGAGEKKSGPGSSTKSDAGAGEGDREGSTTLVLEASTSTSLSDGKPSSSGASSRSYVLRRNLSLTAQPVHHWQQHTKKGGRGSPGTAYRPRSSLSSSTTSQLGHGHPTTHYPTTHYPLASTATTLTSNPSIASLVNTTTHTSVTQATIASTVRPTITSYHSQSRRSPPDSSLGSVTPVPHPVPQRREAVAISGAQTAAANATNTGIFQTGTRTTFTTPGWQSPVGPAGMNAIGGVGGSNSGTGVGGGGVPPPLIGVPGNVPGGSGNVAVPPVNLTSAAGAGAGAGGNGVAVNPPGHGNVGVPPPQGHGTQPFVSPGASMYSFLFSSGSHSLNIPGGAPAPLGGVSGTAAGVPAANNGLGSPSGVISTGISGVDIIEEELFSFFHELKTAVIQNISETMVETILMDLISAIETRSLSNLDPLSRDVFLEHCVRDLLSDLLHLATEDALGLSIHIIELLLPLNYTSPSHKFVRLCRVLTSIMQEGRMEGAQKEAKRVFGLMLEYDAKHHHEPSLKGYIEKEIRDQISFAKLHLQSRTVHNKKQFPAQLRYFVMMIEECAKISPRYVSSPTSLRDDIIKIATTCCVSEPALEKAAYECLVAFFKASNYLNQKDIVRETKMVCSKCEILNSARYNEVSVICQLKVLRALFVSRPSKFSGDKNKIAAAVTAQFAPSKSPEVRMAVCDLLPVIAPWDIHNSSRRNFYCALIMDPVKNVRDNHRKFEELTNIALFIRAVGYEVLDAASKNNLDSILLRYVAHPEVQEACWKVIAAIVGSMKMGSMAPLSASARKGGSQEQQNTGGNRFLGATPMMLPPSSLPFSHGAASRQGAAGSQRAGTSFSKPSSGRGNGTGSTHEHEEGKQDGHINATGTAAVRVVSPSPSASTGGGRHPSPNENGNSHIYLRVGYGKLSGGKMASHAVPASGEGKKSPRSTPPDPHSPSQDAASSSFSSAPVSSGVEVGKESSSETGDDGRNRQLSVEVSASLRGTGNPSELTTSPSRSESPSLGGSTQVGTNTPSRLISLTIEDLVTRCIPFISKASLTAELVEYLSTVWEALPGMETAIQTELYTLVNATIQEAAKEMAQGGQEKEKLLVSSPASNIWNLNSNHTASTPRSVMHMSNAAATSFHMVVSPRSTISNTTMATINAMGTYHTNPNHSNSGSSASKTSGVASGKSMMGERSKDMESPVISLFGSGSESIVKPREEEGGGNGSAAHPPSRWAQLSGSGVPVILPAPIQQSKSASASAHHTSCSTTGSTTTTAGDSQGNVGTLDTCSTATSGTEVGRGGERTGGGSTATTTSPPEWHATKSSSSIPSHPQDSIGLMSLTSQGNSIPPASLGERKPNDVSVALSIFSAREITNIQQLQSLLTTVSPFIRHKDLQVRRSVYRGIMHAVGGWIRYARERRESTHSSVLLGIFEGYIKCIPSELHFNGRQEATVQLTTNVLFLPYLAESRIVAVLKSFFNNTPRMRDIGVEILYTITSHPKFVSSPVIQQSLLVPVESCVLLLEYSDDNPMLLRGMDDLRGFAKLGLRFLITHLTRIFRTLIKRLEESSTSDLIVLGVLKTLECVLIAMAKDEKAIFRYEDDLHLLYPIAVNLLYQSSSHAISLAAIDVLVVLNRMMASPSQVVDHQLLLKVLANVYNNSSKGARKEVGNLLTLIGQLGAVDPSLQDSSAAPLHPGPKWSSPTPTPPAGRGGGGGGGVAAPPGPYLSEANRFPLPPPTEEYSDTLEVSSDDNTVIVYKALTRLLVTSHSESVTIQGLRTLLNFIRFTTQDQKDKVDGVLAAHYLIQIVKKTNESPSLRLEALRVLAAICTLRHEKIVRNMLPEIVVLLEQIWAPSDYALFSVTLDVVTALKPGKLSEKEHSESWEWLYPRLMAVAVQDHSESRELCLRVVEIVLTASYIPTHCLPIIFPALLHFIQQAGQSVEVRSQALCAAVHIVCDLKASEYTASLLQGLRTMTRHCELCDDLGRHFGGVGVLESLKVLSALLPAARPTIRHLVELISHKGPGEALVPSGERTVVTRSPPPASQASGSLFVSNTLFGSSITACNSMVVQGLNTSPAPPPSQHSQAPMAITKRHTTSDQVFIDEEEETDMMAIPDGLLTPQAQDIAVFLKHIDWGTTRKKMREWFAELQKYIILVSPDPSIRMMSDLASKHDPIRRELLNPSFKAIYEVLSAEQIRKVNMVMSSVLQGNDNELVSQCLSLADYLDHNPPKISQDVVNELKHLEVMDMENPHPMNGPEDFSSVINSVNSHTGGLVSDPSFASHSGPFGVGGIPPFSSFNLESFSVPDMQQPSPHFPRPLQGPAPPPIESLFKKSIPFPSLHEELTTRDAFPVMSSASLDPRPLPRIKGTEGIITDPPSTTSLFPTFLETPGGGGATSDSASSGIRGTRGGTEMSFLPFLPLGGNSVTHFSPNPVDPEALHYLSPAGRVPINPFPSGTINLFTPQQIVRAVERTRLYDKAVKFFESRLLQATQDYGLHKLPWEIVHTVVLPLAWLYNKRDMRTSVIGLFNTIHYKGDVDAGRGYELLGAWEDAQRVYAKTIGLTSNVVTMPARLIEGYIRSLFFSAEWAKALKVVRQVQPDVLHSSITLSRCGATAAWVMGQWDEMLSFSGGISNDRAGTPLLQLFNHVSLFRKAVVSKNQKEMEAIRSITAHARLSIGETICRLLSLNYNHAYDYVSVLQHYTEMEELIDYCTSREQKRKTQLVQRWEKRFSQLKTHSPQPKLHTLLLLSIVLPVQELSSMILDFCESMSEQYPKLTHWAMNWLQDGALPHTTHPLSLSRPAFINSNPKVNVGYISHMWSQGRRGEAIQEMEYFLKEYHHTLETKFPSIYAAAELRLGKWKHEMLWDKKWKTEGKEEAFGHFYRAIRADTSSYEAWHSWALINYRAQQSHPPVEDQRRYVEAAHQGFAAAICRCPSATDALPAIMRLLQLWVIHNGVALLKEMVADSINRIPVDYWVQAISQLIGHLNNESYDIREVISRILCLLCQKHPQAVIFPLLVVNMPTEGNENPGQGDSSFSPHSSMKSSSPIPIGPQTRKKELVRSIIQHCPKQVRVEAELVAKLLVNVSAIPIERIREHLSEVASAWNPHTEFEVDREEVRRRLRSVLHIFSQNRQHLLYTVGDVGQYVHVVLEHDAVGETSKALVIVKQLVDEISKHVSEKLGKEPQRAMEPLLRLRNLTIAVFGEYDISNGVEGCFPTITSFSSVLEVIPSKKRPRKIQLSGSDGKLYMYCLKGNEDIRMDERVMQLFGMVNILLLHARVGSAATIHRFPVIPISASVGLLGWVQKASTINSIVCDYRAKISNVRPQHENTVLRNYVESIGHWEKLSIIQRAEALDYVMHAQGCSAMDVANTMWYLANTAEQWLDRRSTYSVSLATMSMVGYVLGLGDRHLGNILLSMNTGKAIHIDFGDSFEVGRLRHVLPETIPFRLTRMLSNAMEVFGVNGSFRASSITTQRVLRSERDSIMSLLSAFIYDPIVQDKGNVKSIMEKSRSPQDIVERIRRKLHGTELAVANETLTLYHATPESARRPDLLYMSKVFDAVAPRVASMAFFTEKQVNFLIDEATRVDNYTVLFVGWGSLW